MIFQVIWLSAPRSVETSFGVSSDGVSKKADVDGGIEYRAGCTVGLTNITTLSD